MATPDKTLWRRSKRLMKRLGLTGLIVTKLDGTAKGGVLAAIALWAQQRNCTKRLDR
jgi:signal recognition particle GTPase